MEEWHVEFVSHALMLKIPSDQVSCCFMLIMLFHADSMLFHADSMLIHADSMLIHAVSCCLHEFPCCAHARQTARPF
jgi:hypothetical protein